MLNLWFGEAPGAGFREVWFSRDEAFDREIRERFEGLYTEAATGALDGWREDARSCLALVILLDQFPRNMFGGVPRMYATDPKAVATAAYAVERGYDLDLPATGSGFLYMPFMHSENLEDQRRSVRLFGGLAEFGTAGEDRPSYAERHMEIIERFGRFPHRNAILGRESTPEEAGSLEQPGSSF